MIFLLSYRNLWPYTPPRLLCASKTVSSFHSSCTCCLELNSVQYFSPVLCRRSIRWWGERLSALTHISRWAASYILAWGDLGFPSPETHLSGLYTQVSRLCPPLTSTSSYFLSIVMYSLQQMPKGSTDLSLLMVSLYPTPATTWGGRAESNLILPKSTLIPGSLESPCQSTGAVLRPRGGDSKPY